MARLGAAWRGCAGLGAARHGMANTLHLFGGAAVCHGEAWQGAAGQGLAGHGLARHGLANTRRFTERRSLQNDNTNKCKMKQT
jgi:hypothetical protein